MTNRNEVDRPALLVTHQEYLLLAAGYRNPPPPPGAKASDWKDCVVRLRWGQRLAGEEWRDPSDGEFREAVLMADRGRMLDEAGIRLRVSTGEVRPLSERMAELASAAKSWMANRGT